MVPLKTSPNVTFDVIYEDGERAHVEEGILMERDGNSLTLHLGTNRASTLFAFIEGLFEAVHIMGLQDALDAYLQVQAEEKK